MVRSLQRGVARLKESAGLYLWETLGSNVQTFRRKVSLTTGMDTYEHWREGDHDYLVLSVALACWAGERYMRQLESVSKPGYIAS
jgi:hypothetical protein